jgi:hypothetical protein
MCYSFTVTGICTLYSLLVPRRAPKTFTKLNDLQCSHERQERQRAPVLGLALAAKV